MYADGAGGLDWVGLEVVHVHILSYYSWTPVFFHLNFMFISFVHFTDTKYSFTEAFKFL